MHWNSEIILHVDPTHLNSTALMFHYDAIAELKEQYFNHGDNKQPSSNCGRLAVYLQQLSRGGWTISFDKNKQTIDSTHKYFFIVIKVIDTILSNWTPDTPVDPENKNTDKQDSGEYRFLTQPHNLFSTIVLNIILHCVKLYLVFVTTTQT